jgi:glycine dehydrogenase
MSDFLKRHIGNLPHEGEMLKTIGFETIDELIDATVPANIRIQKQPQLPEPLSEVEYLKKIWDIAQKNKVFRSYIGQGYYGTITPSVILRNVFENPGWYTAYTPYQAEISQGRLEALLNFQTMVADLTGLPLANASLLDEATAAAEAMLMFFNARNRQKQKNGANKFFVDENVFQSSLDVLQTRAKFIGIELITGKHQDFQPDESFFGAYVQYPDKYGQINDFSQFSESLKAHDIKLAIGTDLMSLCLFKTPADMGADVAVGNTQRFGVPVGFGGPHAAFFAATEEFKRHIPGRIIGVSKDRHGHTAYRMALQTREQHIKRERATSNICTAQALLAIMAGFYAVYHGAEGLREIAVKIHSTTSKIYKLLQENGYQLVNDTYFDTVTIKVKDISLIRQKAERHQINFNYFDNETLSLSIDETVTDSDVCDILSVFGIEDEEEHTDSFEAPQNLKRQSPYLQHPVFNRYHTETEMMRYLKRLENKDISLTHSMISLGSCTMKLNAATELIPLSWPEFANIHPFVPEDQCKGYQVVIEELGRWLCEITGFSAISFQPNSGAQGEYTGLLTIRAYHEDRGENHRNVTLIPSSAHGTNPASAVMAGMEVVVVKCDEEGNIDIEDLKQKTETYKDRLAAIMITYPSTHGVYEDGIKQITQIVHENGGLVYMDGANMNAQVGLTNPAEIGADVCHLNLHKTFAIPHGGGGPGMGPICVNDKLAPYLPNHWNKKTGGSKSIKAVSGAPFGSALILIISHAYINMLGFEGLKKSTQAAILNANYLKAKLEKYYPVLYKGKNGTVAHEMILDCREFKKTSGVQVEDIAKRMIDYGYHAPTVSFPVSGTLMVEPTESESKHELDRFAEVLIQIRKEISDIENEFADKTDNVLINAPHTAYHLIHDEWLHPYSKTEAAYPLPYLKDNKYWCPVGRVDNAYGDRNLFCTCPDIYEFEAENQTTSV